MSEMASAIGELAQGGLTARALEPAHGESAIDPGHTHEGACLNCGAELIEAYCHRCGQRGHVHRTLGAFFHDLLHGVLHFEGKTWRTLPLLAWRPGKLTREYIDGRRASYVSPIALFLFVIFLTFAGFHILGNSLSFGNKVTLNGDKVTVSDATSRLNSRIGALEARRTKAVAAGQSTTAIDEELKGVRSGLKTVQAVRDKDIAAFGKSVAADTPTPPGSSGETSNDIAVTSKLSSVNDLWRKAKQNPDLMIYKLQSNAYKYSWLLIPISVPFVWLLFPLRRRSLYDHTVFVTYSLSFMSLLLLIAAAGAKWGVTQVMVAAVLFVPFHMYRQIHETYGTSRVGAVARTGVLLLFASIAFALWGIAILALIVGE